MNRVSSSTLCKEMTISQNIILDFPVFPLLLAMLSFLNPGDKCENFLAYSPNTNSKAPFSYQPTSATDLHHNYSVSQKTQNKPGKRLSLSAKEQFILVLCRLRQGFSVKTFGISV